MKRKPKVELLKIGDVIKTHPQDGYWGCAIVLNARGKTGRFNPFVHIGTTPIIFRHDYQWDELASVSFTILEFDREVRLVPGIYPTRHETCICIYDARPHPDFPVIGHIDTSGVFSGPLGFEPGNAANGKWPWGGRIPSNLGIEAVVVWRSVHDRTQWLADVEASRKAHESRLTARSSEQAPASTSCE